MPRESQEEMGIGASEGVYERGRESDGVLMPDWAD